MRIRARSLRPLLVAALLCQAGTAAAVTIDWVTVGDAGNAADGTGFGLVADVYRIGRTEVTNAQYAEFLNDVAASDPHALYNTNMGSSSHGGITRSGTTSFSYAVKSGHADRPVNFVSFWDALRFANWMHNGQNGGDTEDGAYTLSPGGIAANSIARNAGASIFLTSEDEWYKAAYYDPGSSGWFDYPVGSDLQTVCSSLTLPGAANCNGAVGTTTAVGSYANSASPVGTFDQAGNVIEWNEAIIGGTTRGLRGGDWFSHPANQVASLRPSGDPTVEISTLGFRLASVPEPGSGLLLAAGVALVAVWRRRAAASGLAAVALLAAAAPTPASAQTCTDYLFPVALAEGGPADQELFGRHCLPPSSPGAEVADTLLVLVHGITYHRDYWDFADPTNGSDRYSFAAAMHAAGYATLAIDRIGIRESSHPLSANVTIDTNAHTVHEMIQAVRAGAILDAGGGPYGRVVMIGHSYGSWTTWFEATRFDDVDAVVLTGATHGLTTVDAPFGVASRLYPAAADPRFGLASGLDPGYLTTRPGERYGAFYSPAFVDPAVIEHDEATKETVTSAEIQTYQLILAEPLDIRVPVFLTVGEIDALFCGPAPGGADCSSEQALIAFESPFLGENVPSVDAYILPAGGHDMNQMLNAGLYFQAVIDWLNGTVIP